ncbi:MFS transporter, partial [Pseudoalteromonas sp. SIMBA_148]
AGYAFGQLSGGPLSDSLGRRPIALGGIVLFLIASLGCAMTHSLEWLMVFRVLQGIATGMTGGVSRTVVRDVATGKDAARLMTNV